jgi:hypothetical protein
MYKDLVRKFKPLLGTNQVDYGGGEVGFSQDPSGLGFFAGTLIVHLENPPKNLRKPQMATKPVA